MSLASLVAGAIGKLGPRPKISGCAGLEEFVDRHASFLAQKCIVEFCRVRAGIFWQKLFDEKEFRDKLTESCWLSYAPAAAMVLEMVDANLRQAAGLSQRALPAALEQTGAAVFARYPVPAGAPADFHAEQSLILGGRMREIEHAPARPVSEMAAPMARLIYDNLPIHKQIVRHDYDYIFSFLRMNLLRAHEDFLEAADLDALARALTGGGEK